MIGLGWRVAQLPWVPGGLIGWFLTLATDSRNYSPIQTRTLAGRPVRWGYRLLRPFGFPQIQIPQLSTELPVRLFTRLNPFDLLRGGVPHRSITDCIGGYHPLGGRHSPTTNPHYLTVMVKPPKRPSRASNTTGATLSKLYGGRDTTSTVAFPHD